MRSVIDKTGARTENIEDNTTITTAKEHSQDKTASKERVFIVD